MIRERALKIVLGLVGLLFFSSAFCVACTLVFYIFPHFDKIVNLWWFDTPMGIFEIALSFWLLFKGIRTPLVNPTELWRTKVTKFEKNRDDTSYP